MDDIKYTAVSASVIDAGDDNFVVVAVAADDYNVVFMIMMTIKFSAGGDHVKFGFPMAWATWVLNYGFLKFRDAYAATGLADDTCDMIKWPLEYFLKAWDQDNEQLYVQVM